MEKDEDTNFFENLMEIVMNENKSAKSLVDLYIASAKKRYEKNKDAHTARFLITHFSREENEDFDGEYAFKVLEEVYNNNKTSSTFSCLMGYFFLYGIGVKKDADRAIDYFLENESKEVNLDSDVYLAKIYFDGLNGFKNIDRGFIYVKKLLDKLVSQMEKSIKEQFKSLDVDETTFKITRMRQEYLAKLVNSYKEAKGLENSNKEEALKLYDSIDESNFAAKYLIRAMMYYEGIIIDKNDNKAIEYFNKYFDSFSDSKLIERASLDLPHIEKFTKDTPENNKIEVVEMNYPLHKKSMIDRFIRKVKEEAEYGIVPSMVKYGECYFNIYQDFPVDYKKSFEIFKNASYQDITCKASLYLFFMYLYGFGTEKNILKAEELANKIKETDAIGEFLLAMICFENHKYRDFCQYIPSFYKKACDVDFEQVKTIIEDNKDSKIPPKEMTESLCYDMEKDIFYPYEVLKYLEKEDYSKAIDTLDQCYEAGFTQTYLMYALCYYYGFGVNKSLYLFKKYVNKFVKSIILTTKEELKANGAIENNK